MFLIYAILQVAFSVAYIHNMVLLPNSGFCNNCTPKRCLHISVHFQTNALLKVLSSEMDPAEIRLIR
jgi:hypothetical protein